MVAIAKSTLPPKYTTNRPIGYMSQNAKAALDLFELAWIVKELKNFLGGPEDYEFSVIMERTTPHTKTRVWVIDRDGIDSSPMIILPEDY
jgi:hypothetical protein